MTKKIKAFTLIELLVVIAIIGILASLIIVSLSSARGKAQDTQRKNNARNLDTALEQYYTDNNSKYPGAAANGVQVDTTHACTTTGTGSISYALGNNGATSGSTLFGTTGYIANNNVCSDPSGSDGATWQRFYAADSTTAGPNASNFAIAWKLASQSEAAVTTGNGVYKTATGTGANTFGNSVAFGNSGGNLPAATNVFVVYGPQ